MLPPLPSTYGYDSTPRTHRTRYRVREHDNFRVLDHVGTTQQCEHDNFRVLDHVGTTQQ